MANFDWLEYLQLAEELCERTDSASHRAAISRAYYSIFNIILDRLKQGGQEPPLGDSHRWVIDSIYSHPMIKNETQNQRTDRKRISHDLRSMRKLRNQADYESGTFLTQDEVKANVAKARLMFDNFQKVA